MLLKIIGEPIAEAELDLIGFKEDLPKEWNLEKTVKSNTRILYPASNAKLLLDLIWTHIDWSEVIEVMNITSQTIMKIKLFNVEYGDWPKFYPGKVKGKREWEFLQKMENGKAVMIIQSLIRTPNYDLVNFIKSQQFMYGSTDNTKVGWVEE